MSFKTKDSVVNRILLDMTQSYTMRKSSKLGQIILSELKDINKLHSQSIERAGFAVLKAPDIPSILVESAFVSNPTEENLLRTEEFRQKVAKQVFDGLQAYAKQNYKLA
jgi:N-acetylmuramoyl-L-alanine amidase